MKIVQFPLALPAPEWCSNSAHPFNQQLYKVSDAELERRLRIHRQNEEALLFAKHGQSHLWVDGLRQRDAVRVKLLEEIGDRWLTQRSHKRVKDKVRRESVARRSRKAVA